MNYTNSLSYFSNRYNLIDGILDKSKLYKVPTKSLSKLCLILLMKRSSQNRAFYFFIFNLIIKSDFYRFSF